MSDSYLSEEELSAFIAGLPRRRLASAALIRDPAQRFLAVQPNYRDGWTLPGGTVEAGEAPVEACFREVEEETGLELSPGRLLLIFHGLQLGIWGDSTSYIYDGGVIDSSTEISLQQEELLAYRWVELKEAGRYFNRSFVGRLEQCYQALESGQVVESSSRQD